MQENMNPAVEEAEIDRFFEHSFEVEGQVVSFRPLGDEHPLFWLCAPMAKAMNLDERFRNAARNIQGDTVQWHDAYMGLVGQCGEGVSGMESMWNSMLQHLHSHLEQYPNPSMFQLYELAVGKRENFIMDEDDIDDEFARPDVPRVSH